MTYDQERTERCLFSLFFRATDAEFREVYMAVMQTDDYREWDWRNEAIKVLRLDSVGAAQTAAPFLHAATACYIAMVQRTKQAIEDMEANR